jgi:hypothetical protein
MSLSQINGDLTALKLKDNDYIVHQANCQTINAKGLAAVLFDIYPQSNIYINDAIRRVPGEIIVTKPVVHLCGQNKPGTYAESKSVRKAWFMNGLNRISDHFRDQPVTLYFPYKIGCGLAGGIWSEYLDMLTTWTYKNNMRVVIVKRPQD